MHLIRLSVLVTNFREKKNEGKPQIRDDWFNIHSSKLDETAYWDDFFTSFSLSRSLFDLKRWHIIDEDPKACKILNWFMVSKYPNFFSYMEVKEHQTWG